MWLQLSELNLLSDALDGGVTREDVRMLRAQQERVNGLRDGTLLGTAIAFLIWIHHAYRNLPTLGPRELRFSPGMAVGSWFIPVANPLPSLPGRQGDLGRQ